ncbi:MAG TPA: zinc-ribbon domain-containing protein [Pyrinomonadaceae bacterium]
MFEPEIDRRCLSCGATVRQQAAFCPQCGQMLDKRDAQEEESDATTPKPPVVEWDQTEAEDTEAQLGERGNSEGNEDSQGVAAVSSSIQEASSAEPVILGNHDDGTTPTRTTDAHDDGRSYKTQPLFVRSSHSNTTVAGLTDTNIRRPGDSRPQGKEHNVLARVDKIRKVSSIMIDQAAYDPSLRFLLVAGALFIVFVILMILSKVLG